VLRINSAQKLGKVTANETAKCLEARPKRLRK